MESPAPGAPAGALAPFRVRSYRFQWPADLATSWAFEMESLILGWYVLVATGSVQLLVLLGALTWIGALFSPFLGVAGDRVGLRVLLCATRGAYALIAGALTALTLSGALEPWHALVAAGLNGLLRPSDAALRNVLIAQTVRPDLLMGALGISRTTTDSAKVAGALAGAGGVALVGMGAAYVAVTALYLGSLVLSLQVAGAPPAAGGASVRQVLADIREGFRYAWRREELLGALSIAFLVNLLAFPPFLGLLPYVAKEWFGTGQAGLGWLASAFALGALAGSLALGSGRMPARSGRLMLWGSALWFVALVALGQTRSLGLGLALLFFCGLVQSFCLVPVAAVLLRSSSEAMRNRVMGMRMLAIWGLPLGILGAGPLIAGVGFAGCMLLYGGAGLAATAFFAWRWRGLRLAA